MLLRRQHRRGILSSFRLVRARPIRAHRRKSVRPQERQRRCHAPSQSEVAGVGNGRADIAGPCATQGLPMPILRAIASGVAFCLWLSSAAARTGEPYRRQHSEHICETVSARTEVRMLLLSCRIAADDQARMVVAIHRWLSATGDRPYERHGTTISWARHMRGVSFRSVIP